MPFLKRDGNNSKTKALSGVLVAVTGGELDETVVRLACRTVKGTKTPLYAVHVVEMPWTEAVDDPCSALVSLDADRVLSGAATVAANYGYNLEPEMLQARAAGPAIVDEASARGCDLLIVGLPYKTRHGQFTLGDTVPYILEYAPMQVWVVRSKQP